VGDRSCKSTKRLWAKIPLVYRHHATCYTDQYVVYEGAYGQNIQTRYPTTDYTSTMMHVSP
jgi:IS1 family transposase